MADYLDVVAFIEGNDGKKRPRTIGKAQIKSANEVRVYLDSIPVGKWDGSLVVQERRQQGDRLSAPKARAPAKPSAGGGDDFAPDGGDDDSIPFVSQTDTVRRWMR